MKIIDTKNKVCSLLRESSFDDEAAQIETFINKIVDKNETEKNFYIDEIVSRCHIKWLGDYYIKGVSYNSWISLIYELKKEVENYRC